MVCYVHQLAANFVTGGVQWIYENQNGKVASCKTNKEPKDILRDNFLFVTTSSFSPLHLTHLMPCSYNLFPRINLLPLCLRVMLMLMLIAKITNYSIAHIYIP